MRNITRRQSLIALAASAAPAVAVAGVGTSIVSTAPEPENPELVKAYDQFLAAQVAVATADNDLDWLIAEWRHRWPSAPEEILGGANADYGAGTWGDTAERDIAGHHIYRNTADLPLRMRGQDCAELPRTCFSVETPKQIQWTIARWERAAKGRTSQSLEKNIAKQKKMLAKFHHNLKLSEAYYSETARVREASCVEEFKGRVATAQKALRASRLAVSKADAHTFDGLRMKAEALKTDELVAVVLKQSGVLGDMARFIDATLEVVGRVQA